MVASIGADDIPSIGGFEVGYANQMTYFPPDDTFYYFLRGTGGQVVALHLDRDAPGSSSVELVATSAAGSSFFGDRNTNDPVRYAVSFDLTALP